VRAYVRLLRNRRYRLLWTGSAISDIGDGASWIALAWTVYSLEGSAADLGILFVLYTAPVALGGPLAGIALDRFDRRRLMIADNLARAAVFATVPVLYAAGELVSWHLYATAAVYGLLKLVPLAGVPSLVPDLVPDEQLDAANAMETIGYSLGVIVGPALGGVALTFVDGPYVLAADAASYVFFAWNLLRIGAVRAPVERSVTSGLRPALRLIVGSRILLVTTVMFMFVNVGEGLVAVLLPVYADELGRGAGAFGAMVAIGAAAGLVGAAVGGSLGGRISHVTAIGLCQVAAGLALAPLVSEPPLALGVAALGVCWLFLGPLTVWAQTLRMREIPAELRGRVFGTLRTAMQAAYPLGGALAPPLVERGGVSLGFLGALLALAVPGIVGLGFLRRG
jgi:MFS family permease